MGTACTALPAGSPTGSPWGDKKPRTMVSVERFVGDMGGQGGCRGGQVGDKGGLVGGRGRHLGDRVEQGGGQGKAVGGQGEEGGRRGQGLTLVHFSPQPEPFWSLKPAKPPNVVLKM